MAQALNTCEFYVPTQRISDGNYLFGTQKLTAKIMNDRLVVRAGGSYMLIDEFLKANAQTEMMATMVTNPAESKPTRKSAVGGSPKRSSFGSPKRV